MPVNRRFLVDRLENAFQLLDALDRDIDDAKSYREWLEEQLKAQCEAKESV